MKKTVKRILSSLLAVVMILTVMPISGIDFGAIFASTASAKTIEDCAVGDTITYGSYPQSKVTDSATIAVLDSISKSWISYGYYSGTGATSDGKMKPSDYMKYCDISYNGNKYRAVMFSSYRPYYTGYKNTDGTYQYDNGYYAGNYVYYFKYVPLTWRVLDPSEGFVMCTKAIDSQAYNNYTLFEKGSLSTSKLYYSDYSMTYLASNWSNSSLRIWLNDNFYKTAFTSSEKSQIGTTYNKNNYANNSYHYDEDTYDKIFLLSYFDIINPSFGFDSSSSTSNIARQIKSTDYAQCQGCRKSTASSYLGNSWWRLRSPYFDDSDALVSVDGNADSYGSADNTSYGIVPAFKFNPKSIISESEDCELSASLTIEKEDYYYKDGNLYDNNGNAVSTVKSTLSVTNTSADNNAENAEDVSVTFTASKGFKVVKDAFPIGTIAPGETKTVIVTLALDTTCDWAVDETLQSQKITANVTASNADSVKAEKNFSIEVLKDETRIEFEADKKTVSLSTVFGLGEKIYIKACFSSDTIEPSNETISYKVSGKRKNGIVLNGDISVMGTKENATISASFIARRLGKYTITVSTSDGASDTITIKVCPKGKENASEGVYEVEGRTFSNNIDYYTEKCISANYDPTLANMTAALSASVYDYSNINNAYTSLEFCENDFDLYDYDTSFNPNTVGYALGFKYSENVDDIICLISIRGSSNTADWIGNFAWLPVDESFSKHLGFESPAERIYENITCQIRLKGLSAFSGNIKYVITGHSRGAAVANLLAAKLMENGVKLSNVYNYNFACPNVALKKSFYNYDNIFNLCNREDIVPFVPGNVLGLIKPGASWGKYGKTFYFTKDAPGTVDPIADHNRNLYLEFFDQQLSPYEWEYSYWDAVDDLTNDFLGWVTKVLCPVDVVITDKKDKKIASVIDGKVDYYDSDFGDVIIFTDGDKKVFYINGDNDFNVNFIGTDTGTMTYSIEKYDLTKDEIQESKTFSNVKLENGKSMYSPVSNAVKANDIELFVVTRENGKNIISKEIDTNGIETIIKSGLHAVSLENDYSLKYKDSVKLNPTVKADSGVKYTTEYKSSNTKVVTVDQNGNVYGAKKWGKGTATITCTVTDDFGNVVTDTCNVTCGFAWWQWIIGIVLFGWIWY